MKTKTGKKATTNISQLARQVGVNRSHVSLILNKERLPSLPVAGRLAKAMGISLDELHDQLVPAA